MRWGPQWLHTNTNLLAPLRTKRHPYPGWKLNQSLQNQAPSGPYASMTTVQYLALIVSVAHPELLMATHQTSQIEPVWSLSKVLSFS